jgi:two-component system, chemotaxis family, sensor kinase CheA
MNSTRNSIFSGKYREIILAVAFFLVFDLAVLVLNFYISYQIADDAAAINLAGRQRMLSQRMTKALLTMDADLKAGLNADQSRAELRLAAGLFDTTLQGFRAGGSVTGSVTGSGDKPIDLTAVGTAQGRQILDQAAAIWSPYRAMLQPLIAPAGNVFTRAELTSAVAYARNANLEMLELMNVLTSDLEQTANRKTDTLRLVQTIGIVLALLNFGFILFTFIGRLSEADRVAEAARGQTGQILSTVKEGLLLLQNDRSLGSQFSASLPAVLGRAVAPGEAFMPLLKAMVSDEIYTVAASYIDILFGTRVKENLVAELNPLTAIEATDAHGGKRYLSMFFSRVMRNGKVEALLVTVQDVSEKVLLRGELKAARERAKREVAWLLAALRSRPQALAAVTQTAGDILASIDANLRNPGRSDAGLRHTLDVVFRGIHTLKGDAAAAGLSLIEEQAHEFEVSLRALRELPRLAPENLISLRFEIEALYARINMLSSLAAHLPAAEPLAMDSPAATLVHDMRQLAARIASDAGKTVELDADLDALDRLPAKAKRQIKDIAVQLLRNAVAHGIETVAERVARAKPAAGRIGVTLRAIAGDEYELIARDDGGGIDPALIRQSLIDSGRATPAELEQLDDRQVMMKIFEPGFSTAASSGRDAGHGIGLDVVKERITKLGGHLRLASTPRQFTEFNIRFAV